MMKNKIRKRTFGMVLGLVVLCAGNTYAGKPWWFDYCKEKVSQHRDLLSPLSPYGKYVPPVLFTVVVVGCMYQWWKRRQAEQQLAAMRQSDGTNIKELQEFLTELNALRADIGRQEKIASDCRIMLRGQNNNIQHLLDFVTNDIEEPSPIAPTFENLEKEIEERLKRERC